MPGPFVLPTYFFMIALWTKLILLPNSVFLLAISFHLSKLIHYTVMLHKIHKSSIKPALQLTVELI